MGVFRTDIIALISFLTENSHTVDEKVLIYDTV